MRKIKVNLSSLKNFFSFKQRRKNQSSYIFTSKQGYRLAIKSSLPNPFEGNVLLSARMVPGRTNQSQYPVGVSLHVCEVSDSGEDYPIASGGVMLQEFKNCAYFDIDSLGKDNSEKIIFIASLPSIAVMDYFLQVIMLSDPEKFPREKYG